MKNKIGIIQTRGLGDIHIALPIALYYKKQGYEVYWPIVNEWVDQMVHYVSWINWIPIPTDNGSFYYDTPLAKLEELKMDRIFCLYAFLKGKSELSNVPYFPHTSFDEFKYIKAKVPFSNKWKLNECIKRDSSREKKLFDKYVKKENYAVTHLNASNHIADFDRSIIPENYQTIEINNDGYVLDWLKIIENAKMLIMTNSVMFNITEQLGIGKKNFYLPRNSIFIEPRMQNNWTWLENKNLDSRTNLTGIKF